MGQNGLSQAADVFFVRPVCEEQRFPAGCFHGAALLKRAQTWKPGEAAATTKAPMAQQTKKQVSTRERQRLGSTARPECIRAPARWTKNVASAAAAATIDPAILRSCSAPPGKDQPSIMTSHVYPSKQSVFARLPKVSEEPTTSVCLFYSQMSRSHMQRILTPSATFPIWSACRKGR